MAARTQSDIESGVTHTKEMSALQAILSTQGKSVSYSEAVDIGHELVGFFEALGEENIPDAEDSDDA